MKPLSKKCGLRSCEFYDSLKQSNCNKFLDRKFCNISKESLRKLKLKQKRY